MTKRKADDDTDIEARTKKQKTVDNLSVSTRQSRWTDLVLTATGAVYVPCHIPKFTLTDFSPEISEIRHYSVYQQKFVMKSTATYSAIGASIPTLLDPFAKPPHAELA